MSIVSAAGVTAAFAVERVLALGAAFVVLRAHPYSLFPAFLVLTHDGGDGGDGVFGYSIDFTDGGGGGGGGGGVDSV